MKKVKENNQEEQQKQTKQNIIIKIIVIIIIILLLLSSCCVFESWYNRKGNKSGIDICDDDNCIQPGDQELLIDCLDEADNEACYVPNFRGKTEKDVQDWLKQISNNLNITFQVYDSYEKDGIVIDQSNQKRIKVKDLLDNNLPLIITFANSRHVKIDCLEDVDNELCIVPNLKGKTKKDVYDWINNIANEVSVNFDEIQSKTRNGKIIKQSIKSGTKLIDVLENNKTLDITFSNKEKVDCIRDDNNQICFVPNFTGNTQKEIEEWLDSISNKITLNYSNSNSNLKSKTVISQSVAPGSSIKDLIRNKIPLSVVFSKNNEDTGVDCLIDVKNSKCILPDFSGMTKKDVEEWLNSISNNIPIRYETVYSIATQGSIVNQSISGGTTVKDILDNNQQLTINISKSKPNPSADIINPPTDGGDNKPGDDPIIPDEPDEPEEPEDPISEDEKDKVIVKDSNIIWKTDSELNIFDNSLANSRIAPESSNTYRFSVNNNTEYDVKYNIKFTETNNYNINMKYKLRKNNTYIVDTYSSIDELDLSEQLLDASKHDVFYLEWKWVSSENDNEIGTNPNASYKLKIEVDAEALSE